MKKLFFKNYTTDDIGPMESRYDVFTKIGLFVGCVYLLNNKWYSADVDGVPYNIPFYSRRAAANYTHHKMFWRWKDAQSHLR